MDINERIRNRSDLKSYFVKNAIPTESNFAEFIESVLNQREDGLVKAPGAPLSVEASGDASSQKKAINFYWDFTDEKPHWVLSLNPRSNPNRPETARPGFSVSDAEGNSRFFVERPSGQVGIGTITPADQLDVGGGTRLMSNSNPLRFTSAWSGFPDGATNRAEISNDTGTYKTLMIVGNKSAGGGRRVSVWDRLEINGDLAVNGAGTLDFGSSVRQMINLWRTDYGIGVQSGTQYFRSGGNFAWYKGGVHNNGALNPGGGAVQMVIKNARVGIGTTEPSHKFHVQSGNAVGLFESTGTQAYLRFTTNEGMNSRVEIANRPGGRLALWVAGGGDKFNITKDGKVGIRTTNPQADVHVVGNLLGAARNVAGQAQRVRCGSTSPNSWTQYGSNGVYVNVNTSHAGFSSTPIYVTALTGNTQHWSTIGGSSVYSATKDGFRVYIRWVDGKPLTVADARAKGWYITWIAIGN